LDQELISYRYSSCYYFRVLLVEVTSSVKSLRFSRFKSDQDQISQGCSSSKCACRGSVGWRM